MTRGESLLWSRVAAARAAAAVALLAALVCAGVTEAAEDALPPAPTDWVEDRADLLPPADEARLSERLERLEQSTGARVVVATYPRLPPGEALEDYTLRTLESWVVWRREEPSVALFVFRDDRKMRLEVGYGAEAVLTDLESRYILDDAIAPEFRRGDFAAGLAAGVDAIATALEGEYAGSGRRRGPAGVGAPGAASCMSSLFILFVFLFLPPLLAFLLGRRGYFGGGPRGRSRPGGVFWLPSSGGFGGGGGFSSGGGFSGGGGSFGGGGASGSW